MLNKLSVSKIAELSKLSKSYISQVKNGKRPPSEKLLAALSGLTRGKDCGAALEAFLKSRREGISPNTLWDYRKTLRRALPCLGLKPTTKGVNAYLNSLSCSLGGKYDYFKCLRAFYNWLYSPSSAFKLRPEDNPVLWVDAPKRPQLILPSLTAEQVMKLIDDCPNLRDKAIVALFTESGLRLSELTNIKPTDIDWQVRIIRVLGKGRKEAYAPFGKLSERYLKEWLAQYAPNGNIWGMNEWGIVSMLRRLDKATGLPCNAHTFRRTFACLLRKAGVDTMTIKDLGRWESLEMVQRYTRSVSFRDSLRFYKAPLS
ncbi:MAG: tyrosine-type recombinase/integrase [Chloroflexota bacterium]